MADRVLVIAGPTGSGKSTLALDAAEDVRRHHHQRRQHAGLPRAARADRAADASGRSAGAAPPLRRPVGRASDARPAAGSAWRGPRSTRLAAAGRLPIVVGGTGLYLTALMKGLAEVPEVPAAVRAEAQALHAALGGEALPRPAGSAAIPVLRRACRPATRQRLIRAYEVACATGRPLVRLADSGTGVRPPASMRFLTVLLLPPRAALYAALDARFERDAGGRRPRGGRGAAGDGPRSGPAGDEGGGRSRTCRPPPRRVCPLDAAAASAKQATRRFAKRQMTWLRHQLDADHVVFEQYSERITAENIFTYSSDPVDRRGLSD